MLRLLFYVIFIVSCIIEIQAIQFTGDRTLQQLIDDEILNSMPRRSDRLEDKLRVLNNGKYAVKLWDIYKKYYNQIYSTPHEDVNRLKNFIETLKFITATNDPLKRKANSFILELNKFSSMDLEEVIKYYTGGKPSEELKTTKNAKPSSDGHNLPASRTNVPPTLVDYRSYMNPIEDQGRCSSSYAFATAATIEGTYAFKKNQKINLSKQQIIDCASKNPCQPWYVDRTLDYIKKNHGLERARSFPYKTDRHTCVFKTKPTGAITGYESVKPGDEDTMKLVLNMIGPLSVVITITDEFKSYKSGILDIPYCSQNTNHAVVIVGYGTEYGQDYWLVRNSWGTTWGDKGYFKIARNKNNMCGIASEVFYVTV